VAVLGMVNNNYIFGSEIMFVAIHGDRLDGMEHTWGQVRWNIGKEQVKYRVAKKKGLRVADNPARPSAGCLGVKIARTRRSQSFNLRRSGRFPALPLMVPTGRCLCGSPLEQIGKRLRIRN
jgi:hypothetical protein